MSDSKPMTEFKKWCVKNGYTSRMISEKTGITARSILAYMQGVRYPSRQAMKKLEEVYEVDTRKLFPL